MVWSPEQDKALLAVGNWLKDPKSPQVFRLFGYAGTGKTTLAKHLAENVEGEVLFAAFTGKAAHVLRQKGCKDANTIHSLIYHTRDKGQAKMKELELQLVELKIQLGNQNLTAEQIKVHQRVIDINAMIDLEKKNLLRPVFTLNYESVVRLARLVVIDECSMVDDRMGEDLLSFGTKVLVLGDPAQLPPVKGSGFFTEKCTPDIMLSEIHRQASGNPIISMATDVRLGKSLPLGLYGDSKIINIKDIKQNDVLGADQILVGRNKTRFNYNKRLRELHGRRTPFPESGDRLVCLRNDHDVGLLNGAIWDVNSVTSADADMTIMNISPQGLDDVELEVISHSHHFLGCGEDIPWWERKKAQEFDYGYALTCHKAQGSQWSDVLVFDESDCFRQDKHRWLYTAITRAADKLTIVKM